MNTAEEINTATPDPYYAALHAQVIRELKEVKSLSTLTKVINQILDELVAAVKLRSQILSIPKLEIPNLGFHIVTLEQILCDAYDERLRLLAEADARSLKKPTP